VLTGIARNVAAAEKAKLDLIRTGVFIIGWRRSNLQRRSASSSGRTSGPTFIVRATSGQRQFRRAT
jgi:hypothetical protein